MKRIFDSNHEVAYKLLVEDLLLRIEGINSKTFTFYINKRKPWQRTASLRTSTSWDKVRTITCYNKETNELLAVIGKIISNLAEKDLDEDQHGFRTERGTLDLTQIESQKAICIDLKDAFHNIKRKRVFRILRKYLTNSQALRLAKNMTPKGYMFQGHPLAPLVLNLALVGALKDIRNFFGDTLIGFHYADDLNFFIKGNENAYSKEMLYSIAGKVVDILKSQGFRVNKRKICVYSSGKCWKTLGLKKEYKLKYHSGYWEYVPPRYLKRKARMFKHWLKIGRNKTQRKGKDGNLINTEDVLCGILNYLEEVRKANRHPQTYRKHSGALSAFVNNIIKPLVNPSGKVGIYTLNEADMKFFNFI